MARLHTIWQLGPKIHIPRLLPKTLVPIDQLKTNRVPPDFALADQSEQRVAGPARYIRI